jgi:hypothetical protein
MTFATILVGKGKGREGEEGEEGGEGGSGRGRVTEITTIKHSSNRCGNDFCNNLGREREGRARERGREREEERWSRQRGLMV